MGIIKAVRCLLAFVNIKNHYDLFYGTLCGNTTYSVDYNEFRNALYMKFRETYGHKDSETMTDKTLTVFTDNGCIKYDTIKDRYYMTINFYGIGK